MKKVTIAPLLLPIILLFFLLISCEKEYLVPESELPQWLKNSIRRDEQFIKDHPHGLAAMGAWNRTRWNDEYYYEYYNLLLSSMPRPISHSGDTLEVWVGDTDTDYHKEKCCSRYVWKGPDYFELSD